MPVICRFLVSVTGVETSSELSSLNCFIVSMARFSAGLDKALRSNSLLGLTKRWVFPWKMRTAQQLTQMRHVPVLRKIRIHAGETVNQLSTLETPVLGKPSLDYRSHVRPFRTGPKAGHTTYYLPCAMAVSAEALSWRPIRGLYRAIFSDNTSNAGTAAAS